MCNVGDQRGQVAVALGNTPVPGLLLAAFQPELPGQRGKAVFPGGKIIFPIQRLLYIVQQPLPPRFLIHRKAHGDKAGKCRIANRGPDAAHIKTVHEAEHHSQNEPNNEEKQCHVLSPTHI